MRTLKRKLALRQLRDDVDALALRHDVAELYGTFASSRAQNTMNRGRETRSCAARVLQNLQ